MILLLSLSNSWVVTVTAVSSSTRENTLKLSDICDLILSEDVHKRDSGESSSQVSNSALNTKGRGRTIQKGQNGQGRSKSRGKRQNFKVTLSVGIMTREVTLPISARHQRRTRLTKIRSTMMMNPQIQQLMNLMMH